MRLAAATPNWKSHDQRLLCFILLTYAERFDIAVTEKVIPNPSRGRVLPETAKQCFGGIDTECR